MKSVGILTLNSQSYNYGGLLQEYALLKSIESLGYLTEVIDYDVLSEANTFSYKRSLRYLTLNKMLHKLSNIINMGKDSNDTVLDQSCRKLFDCFREDYMYLSKRFDRTKVNELIEEYDCFVCGSDQIWNPSFNIPSFFLDFVPVDQGKVIYAASIGVGNLTKMQKNVYQSYLSNLTYISVREQEAQQMIQSITEKNVELVLDPTLLLKREEWIRLLSSDFYNEPYVFCYFLGMDKDKVDSAKLFARNHNLRIISVPFETRKFSQTYFPAYEKGIGPKEFLNFISGAKYVLTDSFHASVFSIIFKKPFRVFTRNSLNTNMNGRIHTLLSYIGEEQLLIDPKDLNHIEVMEVCSYRCDEIERMRLKSLHWLKEAIKKDALD